MAVDPRALTLLLLLLCAAFASVRGVANFDFDCSKPDPSPLNFNLFMELLSNHTDIARSLKPAPVFADMDPEIPAYDITGRGFHLTDGRMSKDIARALCSNNEITFYFSMYLRETHSSGTILEISSGQGARLPVFGVYFNAGADEIMFTYRHRGVPRTVSVDIRLHPGKWRNYAFVLSGHLLEFYFDCTVMFSEVVVLPDFCVDESSLVVTFADDSDRLNVEHSNGVHGYFQNVGFYLGRGGLAQQCPSVQKECPTCGQFLQLVQRAFNLEKENERLKVEIEAQASVPQRRLGMPQNCNEGDVHVMNGEFGITDNGICFCQDGNLMCNSEIQCQEMVPTTDPTPPVACDPPCTLDHQECVVGVCQCEEGFSFIDEQCVESDDTCEVSELPEGQRILRIGEQGFLYQDEENGRMDSCRVFTCMLIEDLNEPLALSIPYGCTQNYTRANCSKELDTFQQNIAVCCQICTPCHFVTCGSHAHCQMGTATCVCDNYYEINDEQECVDIDECSRDDGDNMCFENSKCVNEDPLYSCMCLEGYEMSVLDCQDKNECEAANSPCPENSNCTNAEGSYECNCFNGYEMSEDRSTCAPVCEQPCQNGGTCVSPATCICHPGYTGAQCADDINECTTGTHVCVHEASECINTIGGHFCRCRAGFRGNGTYCEDVNECESEIYQCERRGSICRNTHGSYLCDCNSVDCTGACRRKQAEYPNGMSFIDERNPCMNCTCSNGELVCRQRLCDCSSGETRQCCPECFPSRDCHLESGGQMVSIRPNSIWADPQNPCIRWHCSPNLQLNIEDMSFLCPTLNCPEMFREPQPGRCCPVCLLPSCDGRNEGVTLPLYNGCKSCTCRGGDWNCKDVVTCSQATDCSPQTILFYDQQCCPVCDSTLLGSSPTCRTLNPDL